MDINGTQRLPGVFGIKKKNGTVLLRVRCRGLEELELGGEDFLVLHALLHALCEFFGEDNLGDARNLRAEKCVYHRRVTDEFVPNRFTRETIHALLEIV